MLRLELHQHCLTGCVGLMRPSPAAAQGGFARASGYQAQGNAWANMGNQIAQAPWGNVFNRSGGQGVYYTPSGVDGLDYVNVDIPYR